MSANGQLRPDELTLITNNAYLSKPTANAWMRMKAAAGLAGIDLWPAMPAGAYRSLEMQRDMQANPAKYGLNPYSSVPVAAPGSSSHGYGTRVDVGSFTGARAAWLLTSASKYGFSREFGASDPNHFMHDGRTAIAPLPGATTASSGGITVIVALKDELYVGENGVKPGGSNIFNFVDWTLTAVKNGFAAVSRGLVAQNARTEQINQERENDHAATLTAIEAVRQAIAAGVPVTVTFDPASAELVARIVADKVGRTATPAEIAVAVADEQSRRLAD